eukprot:PhF_6_TR41492/c0_g1_i1/m.62893
MSHKPSTTCFIFFPTLFLLISVISASQWLCVLIEGEVFISRGDSPSTTRYLPGVTTNTSLATATAVCNLLGYENARYSRWTRRSDSVYQVMSCRTNALRTIEDCEIEMSSGSSTLWKIICTKEIVGKIRSGNAEGYFIIVLAAISGSILWFGSLFVFLKWRRHAMALLEQKMFASKHGEDFLPPTSFDP